MTSWGTAEKPVAFPSILQIWGNPSSCDTSPKSRVPLLWGSTANGEIKGLAGTLKRPQLHERKKIPLCARVAVLACGQGEGVIFTVCVVQQGSSEVGTGRGLAKEGAGWYQGMESKVSQPCSHGDSLLSGEVVPPQRGAHGVGRESSCPWGCSSLPGACQAWAKAATASELWERQQALPVLK